MQLRALIVDDEPLARERLRRLAEQEAALTIIGECGDGRAAAEAIRRQKPDLAFLDVQMPGLNGFEVLAELAGEVLPDIIFVTAYDQYAVQAFDVHAVDYLLKPFDRDRFHTAVQRALARHQSETSAQTQQRLTNVLAEPGPESRLPDRLPIRTKERVILLKFADLVWVEAADNYVIVHTGKESHILRDTMAAMEARLPPGQFLRISRSTIVNLEHIKEIRPLFHGDYSVVLLQGNRLTLSRNYREKAKHLLGE